MTRHDTRSSLLAALLVLATDLSTAQTSVEMYHVDPIGSVRFITNESGAVVENYDYAPFGETATPEPFARQFAGKERDPETGFDYFGGRYYAASLGRFTTVDPVLPAERSVRNPQLWNRYSYALNNPLRYRDPDGRCVWDFCAAESAFLSAYMAAVGATTVTVTVISYRNEIGRSAWSAVQTAGFWLSSAPAWANDAWNSITASGGQGAAFPDRALPRDPNGVPVPDSPNPHTQLGRRPGRNGSYPQAREFDGAGKPVRDIDFTDHGRGKPNPHEHPYEPNPTGGTPKRGPGRPLGGS